MFFEKLISEELMQLKFLVR